MVVGGVVIASREVGCCGVAARWRGAIGEIVLPTCLEELRMMCSMNYVWRSESYTEWIC